MIQYNEQDLLELAEVYNEEKKKYFNFNGMSDIECFDYKKLMNYLIKEKKGNIEEILMDFVGAYDLVVHDKLSYINVYNFIFKVPLIQMDFFLNDEEEWRRCIALWRIKIQK